VPSDSLRIREHLKTVHGPSCPKCKFSFEGKTADEHAKHNLTCKYRRDDTREYMSEAQWDALEKMPRKTPNKTPKEQHRRVCEILFGANTRGLATYHPSVDQLGQICQHPSPRLIMELIQKIRHSQESGLGLPWDFGTAPT
jgi:hypothetical protein